MRVKFWGTRGSIPTPGRATEKYGGNTTCVEVQHDKQRVILDGGTGIRELGLAMVNEGPTEAILVFSHFHWDHIQGLPFFTPFFVPGFVFRIVAPAQHRGRIEGILYKQMESDVFPVDFADLSADIRFEDLPPEGRQIGDLHISSFALHHPGGCAAYRIQTEDRSVVYATDNELDAVVGTPDYQRMRAKIEGTDLYIADGQYVKEDFPAKVGWGHSSVEAVLKISAEASVRRLAITHHDPMRDDKRLTELESHVRSEAHDLDLFFARDGLAVTV